MIEFRPKRIENNIITEAENNGDRDDDKKPKRRFTSRSERRRIEIEITGCIGSDDEDYGMIDMIKSRKKGGDEDIKMAEEM